jgi:hypothetical protein
MCGRRVAEGERPHRRLECCGKLMDLKQSDDPYIKFNRLNLEIIDRASVNTGIYLMVS